MALSRKLLLIFILVILPVTTFASTDVNELLDLLSQKKMPTLTEVQDAITSGGNINAKNYFGYSPLSIAIKRKAKPEIILEIIDAGANVNEVAGKNYTPIFSALEISSDASVVSYLIKAGANVNAKLFNGVTVLMMALFFNAPCKVVNELIEAGADVNLNAVNGATPLLIAAMKNARLDILKRLIEAGGNVNHKDKLGNTPLMFLSLFSKEKEKFDLFFKAGAKMDARNIYGGTPMAFTSNGLYVETIKILEKNGGDIKVKDFYGDTNLHSTIQSSSNIETMKYFIDAGISTTVRNEAGETPLMLARRLQREQKWQGKIKRGNKKKAKLVDFVPIIAYLANKEPIKSRQSESELILALKNKKPVNKILKLIKSSVNLEKYDCYGNTSLMIAIESKRSPEIVKALIRAGANLNVRNKGMFSSLSAAIRREFGVEVINEFIKSGADVNKIEGKGITPLFVAIFNKKKEIARALIKAGAVVNSRSSDLSNPLMEAAGRGMNEIVVEILNKGGELEARDNSMNTPLLKAIQKAYLNKKISITIVEILIDAGANVNAADNKGNTPLFSAINWQNDAGINLAKKLMEKGAKINHKNFAGDAILHEIASINSRDGISSATLQLTDILIEKGADIDITNAHGKTPLMLTIGLGNVEIAKKLIKAGADVNFKNSFGVTPERLLLETLHVRGNTRLALKVDQIALILGNAGAKIAASQKEKNIFLMNAVRKKGTLEIVSLLLKAGADPTVKLNTRESLKISPMDYVFKYRGRPELMKLFKKSESNFEK